MVMHTYEAVLAVRREASRGEEAEVCPHPPAPDIMLAAVQGVQGAYAPCTTPAPLFFI